MISYKVNSLVMSDGVMTFLKEFDNFLFVSGIPTYSVSSIFELESVILNLISQIIVALSK